MQFSKGLNGKSVTYPLTQSQIDSLGDTYLASPKNGNPHGIPLPVELHNMNFENEAFKEVQDVLGMVSRNEMPWDFLEKYWPSHWGEFKRNIPMPLLMQSLTERNVKGLADVVHMDSPVDLGLAILSYLLEFHQSRPNDENENVVDFLNTIPDSISDMSKEVAESLHKAFEVKYFYGIARPEEIAGVNCTQYPEGCPTHPSFPAGHGAAAGATGKYFIDNWKLTTENIYVIRHTCYLWAMFRTFAGVHYALDNLIGLTRVGGLR